MKAGKSGVEKKEIVSKQSVRKRKKNLKMENVVGTKVSTPINERC